MGKKLSEQEGPRKPGENTSQLASLLVAQQELGGEKCL